MVLISKLSMSREIIRFLAMALRLAWEASLESLLRTRPM
jgi:hypothetical protein